MDFIHTRFALRDLLSGIAPVADQRSTTLLSHMQGLPDAIRRTIQENAPELTVGQTLQLAPEQLAEQTGLPVAEARRLFTHALGIRYGQAFASPGEANRGGRAGSTGGSERRNGDQASQQPPQRQEEDGEPGGRSDQR